MTRLLLGLIAGAGAALLFAPKSGTELREDLVNRGLGLRDTLVDRTRELLDGVTGSGVTNGSMEHSTASRM